MMKKWKLSNKKEVLKAKIFKYFTVDVESEVTHKKGTFDIIASFDWVNILALNKAGQFILVKQYRAGTDSITYEFAAGGMEIGEEPLVSAKRELLEETGHTSSNWSHMLSVDVNPAFMVNKCHFFLAQDATKTTDQSLDHLEEIEIIYKSKDEVLNMLDSGEISHSLVALGLNHYFRHN